MKKLIREIKLNSVQFCMLEAALKPECRFTYDTDVPFQTLLVDPRADFKFVKISRKNL
jgi:hypothetical protein